MKLLLDFVRFGKNVTNPVGPVAMMRCQMYPSHLIQKRFTMVLDLHSTVLHSLPMVLIVKKCFRLILVLAHWLVMKIQE